MADCHKSTVAALLRLSALEVGDWSTALEQILRVDADTLGVWGVSFWAANTDLQCFFCELGYHADYDAFERGTVLERRSSPSYFQAVQEHQLIDVEDVERDARTVELLPYLRERKIRSLLDVPIWSHGRPVGVLCHEHVGEPRRWTRHDREFVLALGQAVVAALEHRERSKAEAVAEQAMFLNAAATKLSSTLDLTAAEKLAVRRAVPRLGDVAVLDVVVDGRVRRSAVAAADEALQKRFKDAMRSFPPHLQRPHLTTIAMQLRSSVLVPVVARSLMEGDIDEEYGRYLLDLGIRSAIAVPMRLRDRYTGAMIFLSMSSTYGSSDLHLAEDYVRVVTWSLENARQFRRAQDAIGVRDEFLSLASHELRTPLTSLRAAAEAIAMGLPERVDSERLAAVLVRQVDRLDRLAQRLLDAVQVNSGDLSLHRDRVDLAAIVRDVAGDFASDLERAGCRLELNLERGTVGNWDARRLELVVANLLDNAVKFGRGAPIEIAVERGADAALLTVRDHGAGMPTAVEDGDVFVRYERGGDSNRGHAGLGLGLFLVRHIVHSHGGRVHARTHEGGGTTLTVELPYEPRERQQKASDGESTRLDRGG